MAVVLYAVFTFCPIASHSPATGHLTRYTKTCFEGGWHWSQVTQHTTDRNAAFCIITAWGFCCPLRYGDSILCISDVGLCCGLFAAAFGKRSWKMFYCTLRDLVLYLHKDEHGFRKNQLSDNVHNAIRIHHALATRAGDYTKKQHVFRLQTADQSEYLFQTSDSKELDSWIETINYVCAAFSAPPLEGGVGSQKRYQRPLLPTSRTRLLQVRVDGWVET